MNPNDSQKTDPIQSAPETNQTWNRPTQSPNTRPAGQPDGADDDEDVDEGETRQAGTMNPGSQRETPDDAMRRDRSEPRPEKGASDAQSERNRDDRTGE